MDGEPELRGEPDKALPGRGVRVLVIDDEPTLRRSLARILVARGFEVMTAEDGEAGLRLLASMPVDVVLVDLVMPRLGGMDFLKRVRDEALNVEVIIMTAHASVDAALAAVKAGAYDFLTKPFSSPDLVPVVIAKAAEHKRLVSLTRDLEQRLEQKEKFGELVGSSKRMRDVYRMALGVASTSTTVLVLGESGTGKELVARAIHQHSARSSKRFVAVNCGAIPPELLESELFGHTKGAFTGASGARQGLFESADKGTIFLDEVGELPLAAQVKLLRTLQEGEVKPIGANETRTVDVRVLAATNVDLKEAIALGRFREDLYYRLNVIAIELPPLRQRRDDIPLLAYHFLKKYAGRVGRDIQRISVEAMRALREHPWPGNVRELENCIERAVVLTRGDAIMPRDLPFGEEDDEDSPVSVDLTSLSLSLKILDLPYGEAKDQVLDAFHEAYLARLLRRTSHNVSEAARQAGLDRSNFRRLLKREAAAAARLRAPGTDGGAATEGDTGTDSSLSCFVPVVSRCAPARRRSDRPRRIAGSVGRSCRRSSPCPGSRWDTRCARGNGRGAARRWGAASSPPRPARGAPPERWFSPRERAGEPGATTR
jgi:DNA-binding NtrC family response regulator